MVGGGGSPIIIPCTWLFKAILTFPKHPQPKNYFIFSLLYNNTPKFKGRKMVQNYSCYTRDFTVYMAFRRWLLHSPNSQRSPVLPVGHEWLHIWLRALSIHCAAPRISTECCNVHVSRAWVTNPAFRITILRTTWKQHKNGLGHRTCFSPLISNVTYGGSAYWGFKTDTEFIGLKKPTQFCTNFGRKSIKAN